MSFFSKYKDYQLLDENLLAWYPFTGGLTTGDAGPNNNNLSLITGNISSISGASINFNADYFKIQNCDSDSFTAFFDFKQTSNANANLFFSNNHDLPASQVGFFFGRAINGKFFIYISSNSNPAIRFFKTIKTTDRSIFAISRFKNSFTLYCYSPVSKSIKSETVVFPENLNFGESTLKFGNNKQYSSSSFENSVFKLYQFALINDGLPDFVIKDLCEEFYFSGGEEKEDFLAKYISVYDKTNQFQLENIIGNNGEDTSLPLKYSNLFEGFSLLGYQIDSNARFFVDGLLSNPLISGGVAYFSGQSGKEKVLLDNFSNGVLILEKNTFTGNYTGLFPMDKPVVYEKTLRVDSGFVSLDLKDICYGKNLTFKNQDNLFLI